MGRRTGPDRIVEALEHLGAALASAQALDWIGPGADRDRLAAVDARLDLAADAIAAARRWAGRRAAVAA